MLILKFVRSEEEAGVSVPNIRDPAGKSKFRRRIDADISTSIFQCFFDAK